MSGLVRVTLLLFLFPIAVCAAADDLSSPDCEFFYAVFPNRDAAGMVEGKVFDAVSGLSWEQRKALSRTESKRLESILAISPGLVNRIKVGDILVTQGGYQGVTGISINARLGMSADATGKDIISLASMIGYIYFQDSVLLLCRVSVANGIKPAVIHTVLDAGSKDYLNPVSARLLFGMMMGYLNRVESVGYTYEQANDILRVLEFDRVDKPKKKALSSIAGHLGDLSGGKVKLDIRSAEVFAFSTGNKWKEFPQGGDYISRFPGDVDKDLIKAEQMVFIRELMVEPRPGD
ncbi:MAG: hypothetical protein OXE42_01745 [Gammaproteobacteria bacterium]|nr:hypothetical protein [Gammaproteobacteria bacterium]